MEEKQTFMVQDENGIQSLAELISVIEVDGIEYAIYSIPKDAENSDLCVARVVVDSDGNDKIVSIDDDAERQKIFGLVESMLKSE